MFVSWIANMARQLTNTTQLLFYEKPDVGFVCGTSMFCLFTIVASKRYPHALVARYCKMTSQ